MRVLHRDVRIVLEGVDKFSNLIGSVYYPDGESAKDLALELVENGLARYVEWSANMMEEEAKRKLKTAELTAKKNRLRSWTNYVPSPSNSKAIHDQNFTGKPVKRKKEGEEKKMSQEEMLLEDGQTVMLALSILTSRRTWQYFIHQCRL